MSKNESRSVDASGGTDTTLWLTNGAPATGTISSLGDTDAFAIYLVAGLQYTFLLDDATYPSGFGATLAFFRLYSIGGASLIGTSVTQLVNGRFQEVATFTPSQSGLYYIQVSGGGSTGSYVLIAEQFSRPEDYGAAWTVATAMSSSAVTSGALEIAGDSDAFSVGLTAGQRYYYEYTTTVPDLLVSLVDRNYDVVDFGFLGSAQRGVFTSNVTGQFLLMLESAGYTGVGNYQIYIGATYSNTANFIIGGAGNDSIDGTVGPDEIHGSWGGDTLNGGGGDDFMFGGSVDDISTDFLDGGSGNDLLVGGKGNDFYRVDSAGDVVQEYSAEGVDTVYASVSYVLPTYVENLFLEGSTGISATGNSFTNEIVGNAGNNSITGAEGADTIDGGAGFDTATYSGSRSSYTLTRSGSNVIVSGGTDGGDTLVNIERLQFSDGFVSVGATNSAPTGSVTITGTPALGQVLTASNSLADADGLGSISYQWQANGVDIAGATGSTFTLAQSQVGQTIVVVARYTDGFGVPEIRASSATATVTAINRLPTGTVTITGTATQGQTLTASNTLADADGLGPISYQWQANGVDISGATGSTLVLAQAQVGQTITVVARYTDGLGTAESRASSATAAVANINDTPTGTVTITGTVSQGQTLTASNTLADADGLGPISYQWRANGVDIAGANGSTLVLAQAQVGQVITVVARYTDGFGAAESRASSATAAVGNINDAPTGTVTITGTATQGQTLTASNTLADADGLGPISYQWRANGVDIAGATGSTFVLAQAQVGTTITVLASYTDGFGTAESRVSSATASVVSLSLNLIGTAGPDVLSGAASADSLSGLAGNDTLTGAGGADSIDGGVGFDTSVYSGSRSAYTITRSGLTVTVSGGPDGGDTLVGIERLQFSDGTFRLWTPTNDFDGDGKSDVLWRNSLTGSSVIWSGGSSGSSVAVTTVSDTNWRIAGTGDFDGDGKADILWRNGVTGLNAYWKGGNSGTGQDVSTVSDLTWSVAGVGDFDGDGTSDILWRNSGNGANVYWKGGNSQNYTVVAGVADASWTLAAVGDFDGDGTTDIFWRNTVNGANVIWNGGSYTSVRVIAGVPAADWTLAAVGDFNGDGTSDVLWRNTTSGVNIVWNGANNGEATVLGTQSDFRWQIETVGDFDFDGKSDILWRNVATGANVAWLGGSSTNTLVVPTVADTSWRVGQQFGAPSLPKVKPANDFNGDGKSDLLWHNDSTGQNTIWLGANSATVQAVSTLSDTNWKLLGTGDFDGDGKADLLWRNTATGANALWNAGNSANSAGLTTLSDQAWKVAGIGDFDRDGKSDILWRNTTTGANVIWKAGSSSNVQDVTTLADTSWKIAGVGDFDGDGRADILWRNSTSGTTVLWNGGNSAETQGLTTLSDQAWKVAGIGDFDGDGRMDILWRNTSTGANQIWKSADSANQITVANQTDQAWQVGAVGDYDGDGKADILWRNASTGADVIWKGGEAANQQAVVSQVGTAWHPVDSAEGDPGVSAFIQPVGVGSFIAGDPINGYF